MLFLCRRQSEHEVCLRSNVLANQTEDMKILHKTTAARQKYACSI